MAIKTKIDGNSRISLSDDQLFDQSTANTNGGIDSTSANTFIGYLAGQNVDAGSVQNTFIGHGVGDASLNDSVGNTGIGANVLSSLTTGDYNTIIGRGAGESMTSGAQNTVVGNSAFSSANGDEDFNVVIGQGAGYSIDNDNADYNVIIGTDAGTGGSGQFARNIAIGGLALNSTGSNELTATISIGYETGTSINHSDASGTVMVGHQAGGLITSGRYNVLIGQQAGNQGTYGITTGDANTVIGYQAMASAGANITGDNNTAIGYSSMLEAQGNVYQNTAVGSESMTDILTGVDNVSIGYYSMRVHTTGSRNTVAGSKAMQDTNAHSNIKDSSDNTFLGYLSGGGTWTGSTACSYNTAVGSESLEGALDGAGYNVAVGWRAGDALTTGDKCTVIGAEADAGSGGAENQTAIGYGTQAVDSNNSVTIGNASVDTVCMSQDQDATVHCGGVRFPSSFSNNTNANTLDDYEEGTFSPVLDQSGASSISYTTQSAGYTKIGRQVTVQGEINVGSYTAGSGAVRVGGMPFSNSVARGTGSVSPTAGHTFADSGDASHLTFEIIGTVAYISETTSGGRSDWSDSNLSTSGWRAFFSATYMTAD